MTFEDFRDAVVERIFMAGHDWKLAELLQEAKKVKIVTGDWPDPGVFAERCLTDPTLTSQAKIDDHEVSATSGACAQWLAVHEAGHAIVALKAGFNVGGARFCGDNIEKGAAYVEDGGGTVDDDAYLEKVIRVSVAGNVAESIHSECSMREKRISGFFGIQHGESCPSDFCRAYKQSRYLACNRLARSYVADVDAELLEAMRGIVLNAEAEAESDLRTKFEVLERLGAEFRKGPMYGTTLRQIVEA